MGETSVPMKEFLLWSNCGNNCQFCWQRKLDKPETLLTDAEKLEAISAVREEISSLPYTDILIVGGEVYSSHTNEVDMALLSLFSYIRERIDAGLTRLFYANTNLLYEDQSVLVGLLNAFEGAEDRLRLTTSYDIYGRYATEESRQLFLTNLRFIATNFPDVHPVVNCILTKQMCNHITSGDFDIRNFARQNNLAFINFIPYIPIEYGDAMTASWNEITEALIYVDTVEPHYLRYYKDQMDLVQDRVLKEYHKDTGLVECTASYMECGHNVNYSRATGDDTCYVCKMKSTIAPEERWEDIDQVLTEYFQSGGFVVTVGDVCSYNVWTQYGQPNIVIFDGRSKEDVDVLQLVRQSETPKFVAVNIDEFESEDLDLAIFKAFDSEVKCAVQVDGEEDPAIFPCLRVAPASSLIVYGDPHDKRIKYTIISKTNTETPETSYEVIDPSLNSGNQV